MRQCNRHFGLVLSLTFCAALSACGPAKVAETKAPSQVHGDLIASAPVALAATPKPTEVPKVKATAAMEAPKATLKAAVPAQPKPPKISIPQAAPAAPRQVASSAPEYPPLGFDMLASYNFEVDETPLTNAAAGADKANDQIPGRVKVFDRRKVSIKGFMLPLKVSNGVVTEFLIMKDQSMCCYGSVPKITEWVSVKTGHDGVKSIMDQPVSIEGTLHVGAMRENGYLIGIYHMDGDKLIAPEN